MGRPLSSTTAAIVLLNNYPMRDALERTDRAEYPAQHLWGYWHAPDALKWKIPPRAWAGTRSRVVRALLPIVGDVPQQIWAIRNVGNGGVIYAADQQSAALVGALRRLRIVRKPLVLLIHNGPRNAWSRWWMKGSSQVLVLSDGIADRVSVDLKIERTKIIVMPWGPQLESPVYRALDSAPSHSKWDFVAAGKTNRDYVSLARVAREHKLSGIIFDGTRTTRFVSGAESVEKVVAGYPEILRAMQESKCVVIPLSDRGRLSGLTEAADALALGVRLVVTKSNLFPYDVAALGGRWLVTGTDEELLRSINDTVASESAARTAYESQLRSHDMTNFSRRLSAVFLEVGKD